MRSYRIRGLYIILLSFITFFLSVSCSTENTPVYQLNTSSNPSEGGTVTPTQGEYDQGAEVEIIANPDENWVFQQWQGDLSSSNNPATVTMDSDKIITALFEKREYPLNISIEGEGTVQETVIQSKSTDYVYGTVVELTAKAAEGWEFVEWQGDISTRENPFSLSVGNETSVTAMFSPLGYELNIEIKGNGTVEEAAVRVKSTEYPYGTQIQLAAIPDENWSFDLWGGDFKGTDNPVIVTIEGKTNIKASFITFPTITTTPIDKITFDTAKSGGEITNNGGSEVLQRGVCWSISEEPTVNDNCTNDDAGLGSFTSSINKLNLGTIYYVRAYAVNKVGIVYGNQVSLKTRDTIKDIDGNKYKVVKIGYQYWLAENLKTTKYRDGSKIPNFTDNWVWKRIEIGAWSYYNNDSSFNSDYGKLYNWRAVDDERGLCPKNWKVPSMSDWNILVDYVDEGSDPFSDGVGRLKDKGTQHWNHPNSGATDEFGFKALPGGARTIVNDFKFAGLGKYGYWWTSTESLEFGYWGFMLFHDVDRYIMGPDFLKENGFSVRCIMNY